MDYKRIVQAKTRAILGEYYDASSLENEDDEDMTEVLDGSADERRQMRKCMVAQAKSFRELEALIDCLDYVETSAELQLHMRQSVETVFSIFSC